MGHRVLSLMVGGVSVRCLKVVVGDLEKDLLTSQACPVLA